MDARSRRPTIPLQLSWPIVGRDEELAWANAVRRDGSSCGIVVSGVAGVGKTRLAREVVAVAREDGLQTEWVHATRAAASIPLGAFAGLMPSVESGRERVELFQHCADALRARGDGQRVVVGVDDAHLLDPTSAALVLHLATIGTGFVVVTIRAGERSPDSIVALWKDLEAPRLELQQLSAEETAVLLERGLGGEVAADVTAWAYGASEGHALYLRELVSGALASGALVSEGGRWRLRSRPAASLGLVELISAALAELSADELEAAQLLALGEPLDLDVIADVAGPAPVSALEEKGLALVVPGDPPAVRFAHPLYGEVVRNALPTLRGSELRRGLATALRAKGLDRPGDALRVVTWLDDAGAHVDEPLLLAAAHDANAAGEAELAERFASRAPSGPESALVLARAHAMRGRFGAAEEMLAPWEGSVSTWALAAGYLDERAYKVLYVGLGQRDDALALVDRARGWFPDDDWRERVELVRLDITSFVMVGASAIRADLAELRRIAEGDASPEVRRHAHVKYALSLTKVGRYAEMRAVTAPLRPDLPLRDDDDHWAFVAWWQARLNGGFEWDTTERWLLEAHSGDAARADPRSRGEIALELAWFALRRGKPATAARRSREAIDVLERIDPLRRLPLACLTLAQANAMTGDARGARAALSGFEAATAVAPAVADVEARTRAALAVLEGERSRAVSILLDSATLGEQRPLTVGGTLHDALRFGGPPRSVAPALQAAVEGCDAPIARLQAQLAAALVARDAEGLLDNARGFGEIGAWLWAAESAALAARAYGDASREDSARRALALSARFLEDCETPWSPVLRDLDLAPAELTEREREIVALAANGASNAEIAERLVLSVRTVESHLYRAMRKLGVATRQDLRLRG